MRSLKERSVPRILLALLCANAVVPSIGKETFPNGLHRAGHEGSIDEGSIRVLWPAESAIIAPGVAVPFVFRVHEPHWVTTGYTVEVTIGRRILRRWRRFRKFTCRHQGHTAAGA